MGMLLAISLNVPVAFPLWMWFRSPDKPVRIPHTVPPDLCDVAWLDQVEVIERAVGAIAWYRRDVVAIDHHRLAHSGPSVEIVIPDWAEHLMSVRIRAEDLLVENPQSRDGQESPVSRLGCDTARRRKNHRCQHGNDEQHYSFHTSFHAVYHPF